jgi:rod shape-determining protein MreB
LPSNALGLDLGSSETKVWYPPSRRLFTAPTVVAARDAGEALAVGEEARRMVERAPAGIRTEEPIRDGRLADVRWARAFLAELLRRIVGRRLWKPRAVLAVPAASTSVERRALVRLVEAAGVATVDLVPSGTLAALALDVDIEAPRGHLVIDAGAGETKVDVVSLGRIVLSRRASISLTELAREVARTLRDRFGLLVGGPTAQALAFHDGDAVVAGRHLGTGGLTSVAVPGELLAGLRGHYADAMAALVAEVLASLHPELLGDLIDQGVHLVGGGALLPGLDRALSARLDLPVLVAPEPTLVIAEGLRRYLRDERRLRRLRLPPVRVRR